MNASTAGRLFQKLPIVVTALLAGAALLNLAGTALDGLPAWAEALLDTLSFFAALFLSLLISALPLLLLGALGSGLVAAFFDRTELAGWFPRQPLLSALCGSLLGLFLPVGECGVIPLARRLLHKGAPVPAAIAMLLAAPALNPIVIASTLAAFGPGLIFWGRFGLTLLVATLVGWVFSLHPAPQWLLNPRAMAQIPSGEVLPARAPFSARLKQAMLLLVDEFFELGSRLVLGALLAALLQMAIRQPALLALGQGPVLSAAVMSGLGVLRSLSATDDAFVVLPLAGPWPGAVLAFLVFGSMLDLKSGWMLTRVVTLRTLAYIAGLALLLVLIAVMAINFFGQGWLF